MVQPCATTMPLNSISPPISSVAAKAEGDSNNKREIADFIIGVPIT